MNGVLEYVSSPAPLWATGLLVVLAFAAGRLFRRATLVEARLRAQAAEQAAEYATGRAGVQQPVTEVLTRVLAEPVQIAGSDLPTRYGATVDATMLAADWPPPTLSPDAAAEVWQETRELVADLRRTDELVAASSLGTPEAVELRGSVSPAGALTGMGPEQADWEADDPYEVEPADDADDPPRDEARVTRYGAGLYGEVASPTMTTGPLPRYDWQPVALPPGYGVMPDSRLKYAARMLAKVVRRRRLAGPAWTAAAAIASGWRTWLAKVAERVEARRAEQAAKFTPGWAPGQITTLVTGRPSAGESPELLLRWQHRRSGRVARLVARLLARLWRSRTVPAVGRHRPEVAPGALAQRQTRLLALTAGAR